MFRDSRGVVHTVSAGDPLDDLPAGASRALQEALLRPVGGSGVDGLAGALERCEAVRELVERWQDAFFATLPDDVDLAEEARWAAEAGLDLADVEAAYDDEDDDEDLQVGPDDVVLDPDLLGTDPDLSARLREHLEDLDGEDLAAELGDALAPTDPDDPRATLGEELVGVLERELLLLPLRVRLEALVAASDLVGQWADLYADHEKALGHLVLTHGAPQGDLAHHALADAHAALHALHGPGHGRGHGRGPGDDDPGQDRSSRASS